MDYNRKRVVCTLVALTVFMPENLSQEVLVTLTPQTVVEGDAARLECGFICKGNLDSSTDLRFHNLAWVHNNLEIVGFFLTFQPIAINKNAVSNYSVSCNDTHSALHLHKVHFAPDSGNYTCEVEFIHPSVSTGIIRSNEAHAFLTVDVPPKAVVILDQANQPTADVSNSVAGEDYQFTCVVPDINPAASIKWRLGNTDLEGVETSREEESGLITTNSTVKLTPAWRNHNEILSCSASNIKGRTGKSTSVALDVKVLPTVSSMSLSDDSGLLADGKTVTIQHGLLHNFSCEVRGTRPSVTIRWYLGEALINDTFESTTGGEHGLVNTSSFWSFIPVDKEYYDKQLKCVAFTGSYSKYPLPSVHVKLYVKTMAPTCVIKNTTSMSAVVECSPAYDSIDILRIYHLKYYKSGEQTLNVTQNKKGEGGTVEFTLRDLEPFTSYTIEAFKNDSFGFSEVNKWNFTTLPMSPGELSTDDTTTDVSCNWIVCIVLTALVYTIVLIIYSLRHKLLKLANIFRDYLNYTAISR